MGKAKVLAALSGGVDSSVAAALALRSGADVVGITMLLYGGEKQGRSCSTSDESAAAEAAAALGVRHVVVDHTAEFSDVVMGGFAAGARAGATPNPCISCNKRFKLDWLFGYARAHGFDQVVTGHHARVVDHDGRRWLARGLNEQKDQSYVLYAASAAQLDMLVLPLGDMTDKGQVRAIADELSLPAAQREDSMELCFSRADAIGALTPARVVDADGRDVGMTSEVELVTVGQRRGLARNLPAGQYVTSVNPAEQVVYLGRREDLLVSQVAVDDMTFTHAKPVRCYAQSSAHGALSAASLSGNVVSFDQPVRRPSPGQHVVLYVDSPHGLVVAGGGAAI